MIYKVEILQVEVHWHYLKADATYKPTVLIEVYLLLCSQ